MLCVLVLFSGLAGLLVASTRISIKLIISSDELSTVIFFLTSTTYIALSYVLHSTTVNSPYVRYHMKACSKIILRPDEDRVMVFIHTSSMKILFNSLATTIYILFTFRNKQSDLMEDSKLESQYTSNRSNRQHTQNYGMNQLNRGSSTTAMDSNNTQTTGLSFSNPVYELSNPSAGESAFEALAHLQDSSSVSTSTPPSHVIASSDPAPAVAFKVEHVLAPSCTLGNRRFGSFRSGIESRWRVAQAIYPYMVCIAMAYCVTLSLYPGIESEIISCSLKSWMPVLLMFMFNTSDVIGKVSYSTFFTFKFEQNSREKVRQKPNKCVGKSPENCRKNPGN